MKYKALLRQYYQYLNTLAALVTSQYQRANISIFHEFRPSPGGGGHQFLRALRNEFIRRGLKVENNRISPTTQACLFNSYNFNIERLQKFQRLGCRMVHRIDGPMSVYRGRDDGSDRRIWLINQEFADVTILQSRYSLEQNRELGFEFKSPFVVINAVDPNIFNKLGRILFDRKRKIRLISTSWSDNPNKGAPIYKWIEEHLDWDQYEYTFVGRTPIKFTRIQVIPPVPSKQLAGLLRQHDIYVFASKHEACSNALIESLSCGLPSLFIYSGANAEIVGEGGLGFMSEDEIPNLLNQLVTRYEYYQSKINLPKLVEIADRYLSIIGIRT